MFQMKEQDETLEAKWNRDRQSTQKRIQCDDSKNHSIMEAQMKKMQEMFTKEL